MDAIFPSLKEQYERERARLCHPDPFAGTVPVSVDDVLRAHYLLCDYFIREGQEIALAGSRNDNLLVSAVGRQATSWDGSEKWKSPFEKAGTLFFGLVKNHPFHDGNKRCAFLIAVYQLIISSKVPVFKQKELEQLTVRTAANELHLFSRYKNFRRHQDPEVRFIAEFFRRKTRPSDKRRYQVTYRQLNSILVANGFALENPDRSYIDVVRVEKSVKRWTGRPQTRSHRVFNMAFAGWNRTVPPNTVKEIRRVTGLTPENGVDSQVFYRGADPLDSLISDFHGPLLRLKDK